MKVKSLLATTLCGMVMFSCSTTDEGPNVPVQGEEAEITLVVETRGKTRADDREGTDEESAISKIEFYVFDKDGDPDTKVGNGSGYLTGTAADLKKTIIVSSGDNKKFVTVINSNLGAKASYSALKSEMAKLEFTASLSAMNHNSRVETSGAFEMTGEAEASVAPASRNTIVRIDVDRIVSRVNAPIYKNGSNDTGVKLDENQIKDLWGDDAVGIDPADISFEPLGYAVINGLSHSDAFVVANNANWWNGKTYLRSSFNSSGFYTNTYSGKGVASDWFLSGSENDNEHRVYLYENNPQEMTDADGQKGWDARTVNAIMLKGELQVAGKPSLNKERYWRVNLTHDDNYHIERNSVYDVYVQNIITIGHDNPEEGEIYPPIIPPADESSVDVHISVSNWTLKEYKTEV